MLLQKLSIDILGVSILSIKLPSLILGFLSAVSLITLLRYWFKPNVAVLASIIAIATGQYLFIAQDGTPSVLYILWSIWLLLLATLIAKNIGPRMLWKILFFIVGALSLYTPLSVYAMIAIGIAIILHPHLRYLVRQLSRPKLIIAGLIGVFFVLPLVIGIINTPELGLNLLGIPKALPDLYANLIVLSRQYFGFYLPSSTAILTPVFGLGTMLIITFGAYRLVKTHSSTQSYLVMIWILCLIPILLINPSFTSITFVPFVLLLATGIDSLLRYWYRLFPRNPYPRIAGLVPIVILVGALVISGIGRYAYDYAYDPSTVNNFSKDLNLMPKDTHILVVSDSERPFYEVVAKHSSNLSVSTSASGDIFTATQKAKSDYVGYHIINITTSQLKDNADRFYVYKKNEG
jgi:4-amino-4-deoxy-L-arabinose transferase-like glycosyltransferase